jgi:hypothetical protein
MLIKTEWKKIEKETNPMEQTKELRNNSAQWHKIRNPEETQRNLLDDRHGFADHW